MSDITVRPLGVDDWEQYRSVRLVALQESPDAFVARLTAAYQAYYEHMPVRTEAVPNGAHIRMHRRLDFGLLARLQVLDTRQYRSDQATTQEGAQSPLLTMLGADQRALRRRPYPEELPLSPVGADQAARRRHGDQQQQKRQR